MSIKKVWTPPSTADDPVGIYGELRRKTWYITTPNLLHLKKKKRIKRDISKSTSKLNLKTKTEGKKIKECILIQSQGRQQHSNVISDTTGTSPSWLFVLLPERCLRQSISTELLGETKEFFSQAYDSTALRHTVVHALSYFQKMSIWPQQILLG